MSQFPRPSKTNGLLVTLRPDPSSALLVIGCNRLASSRVFTALEAGFTVYVAYSASSNKIDAELSHRIEAGEIRRIELVESHLLDSISEIPNLEIVCVTDSLLSSSLGASRRSEESCALIAKFCNSRHIHINIVDRTAYNDISFPATHRWRSDDGQVGHSLQIAVNTFGKGCRLATRIKREIVATLPTEIGKAVDNVATIRGRIIDSTESQQEEQNLSALVAKTSLDEEDDQIVSEPLNTPVTQFGSPRSNTNQFPFQDVTSIVENAEDAKARRMKWVAQISEYWPIRTLGRLQQTDIDRLLADFDGATTPRIPTVAPTPVMSRSGSSTNVQSLGVPGAPASSSASSMPRTADASMLGSSPLRMTTSAMLTSNPIDRHAPSTLHSLSMSPPQSNVSIEPRVLLLGSGPGHPALLTVAAYHALCTADLVLIDKLVPAAIVQLIPSTVEKQIAKKFPGNAEQAQIELHQMALDFIRARRAAGLPGTVVRLKQGDPYIYGRGGEEVLFFRTHGIEAIVVPGISSAIAAPLLCNIPVTQRGVSDSLILCTGVGRAGKTSIMPGFRRSRTLVVLMGVARIGELITALTSDDAVVGTRREAEKYPLHLPIALIERGSSKDQRMLLSTLGGIEAAIERVGDQRPPGMLVIGWCCLALEGAGNVDVLETASIQAGEQGDVERVNRVLGSTGYLIRNGVTSEWMNFLDEMARKAR